MKGQTEAIGNQRIKIEEAGQDPKIDLVEIDLILWIGREAIDLTLVIAETERELLKIGADKDQELMIGTILEMEMVNVIILNLGNTNKGINLDQLKKTDLVQENVNEEKGRHLKLGLPGRVESIISHIQIDLMMRTSDLTSVIEVLIHLTHLMEVRKLQKGKETTMMKRNLPEMLNTD